MGKERMQFCFNCGAEIGVFRAYHGDINTCGAQECEREARNTEAARREEAHEQLDRDNGWGGW